ncbi:oligosaccharide flippase family protein [Halogeometricum limi]|uniref:Membrane protein involved in the export of O-antigen and teichoic acid n=1 Tax=Halogeometricum limi TaxID=555875 RepID=A0A1I6IJZ5_9EURY|nr:oligosaccharide flippase family protein [Halogeometricum limi]SFR66984.1 Membrane protein involved in the export of O-antigen and teichoic acid [Halogeometricum limi]
MSDPESEKRDGVLGRFVRDFGLYSVAKVVPAITSLLALVIFTRFFPPSSYGMYALAATFVGIFSSLCFDWVGRAVYRFAAEIEDTVVVGNAVSLVTLTAAAFTLLATVVYFLFEQEIGKYRPFYIAVVVVVVVQGFFQIFTWFFQTTMQSKRVMGYRVFESVLKLGFSLFIAIVLLEHIVGWIWGAVVATGLTVLAMGYKLGPRLLRPRLQPEVVTRFSRYGIPMLGWIIGVPLLGQADLVVLEFIRGTAAVGVYSSNYQITDRSVRLVFAPIIAAAYPIIMNALNDSDEEQVADLLTKFTRYFFIIAIPTFVGIAVLSLPLSSILLDDRYREGYVIIPLVASGVLFLSLANLGQISMEIRERTKVISGVVLGAVVVNLVLNVPLITYFGYLGAAVATAVSYAVYAAFIYRFSKQHLQWRLPTRTIRNSLVGGVLMSTPPVLLYVTGMYSIPRIVVALTLGCLLYAMAMFSLDEIDRAQLRSIVD